MPELLLEFFSEEIPARMQTRASDDLKRLMLAGLKQAGVGCGEARAFATPRRLTLVVADVERRTQAVREEVKGPRVDAPEQALAGFLRKTGLAKQQLEIRDDKKGQVYFAVIDTPGRATVDVLAELAPDVARGFPWPKSMRWGARPERWVRPLRSILCLLGDGDGVEVPGFEFAGLASGGVTHGHRFHAVDKRSGEPKPLTVNSFKDYRAQLRRAKVMLDPAERMAVIERDAARLAEAAGLEIAPDPGLLREAAGLVEWPVALIGAVEERFQALPTEVLQTSMREHQKFFAARDAKSGRIEKFVTIANIEAEDGGAQIVAGNERVLRARLSDAEFFYRNDLAQPLEALSAKLADVTFHNRLGGQAARVARVRALARELAPMVGAAEQTADRAAQLAKADLASEMVYEFPELQGVMGGYYAIAGGEDAAVGQAIREHYAPVGPSDDAPAAPVSIAVALADKLDSLACFWAIGAKPTGSGDPFALRRAALGVIRIIHENGLRLRLAAVLAGCAERVDADVAAAAEQIGEGEAGAFDAAAQGDLMAFFRDRLKVWLRDQGARHDLIDAVYQLDSAAAATDDLTLMVKRIEALRELIAAEHGADLLAAFKRANNILNAEEKKDGVEYSLDPHRRLAEAPEEEALFDALDAAEATVAPALEREDFAAATAAMAALRGPLDRFFDAVLINAEAEMVRRNRLCLLNRIRRVFSSIADFSAIEG